MKKVGLSKSYMHWPQDISRRQALSRLSAGALLSLGLWPGCAYRSPTNSASFRFIAVNDVHYMSPECGEWLHEVVNHMKSHEGIEFCLLSGDLTEHGEGESLRAVREIFHQLNVPTYVVIGNHDYESATSRQSYERAFPRRINYLFRHRGWQFVGLDTSEGQRYQKTSIQPATFHWLDENLRSLDPVRPTVIFTHFPLGEGVTYRPSNADALLERFLDFNLQAVFNGHFHGFTERTFLNAAVTTNKCCALKRGNHDGTKGKGYFLCQARDGQIERAYIEMTETSST